MGKANVASAFRDGKPILPEIAVERERRRYAEPFHHGEANSVRERERFVGVAIDDVTRTSLVSFGWPDDVHRSALHSSQKTDACISADLGQEQRLRFGHDIHGSDKTNTVRGSTGKNPLGGIVVWVTNVGRCEEAGRIDEPPDPRPAGAYMTHGFGM